MWGILTMKIKFLNKLKNKETFVTVWNKIASKKYFLMLSVVILTAIVLLSLPPNKHTKKPLAATKIAAITAQKIQQAENNKMILGMQSNLDQIKKELTSTNNSSADNVAKLQKQLLAVEQNLARIEHNTVVAKLSAQQSITFSKMSLADTKKATAKLESQLRRIHRQLTPPKYLPVRVLPFKPVSLDFWNGRPMVTVAQRDINGTVQYKLIGKGMGFRCGISTKNKPCSNWVLASLRTHPNIAIFRNVKNQKVRVEL